MKKILFLALGATLAMSACKKDDPKHTNQSELITTVRLVFTPASGGGAPVTFQYRDLDGDGGNAPVITNPSLAANTTYNVSITVLDESKTPASNISTEIETEDAEHMFFFVQSNNVFSGISYNDFDANSKPVGLLSTFITGAAATGQLDVQLRHEPTKPSNYVAGTAIPSTVGGETDIEVSFNVTVQ